ncbi:Na(+)-translocating NADH-quinone reductase subunit A [Primorskyibacter aestuariivivens]|uniref:Na(+)-translocating NADH-quinone reductase subunit A n=1 Tax=Primorskyibacter aestuariivivens TaxID=1888912 RepID=UPI002300478D|nr:Na(+)-translocating NADH-quinone reductase subunit A [Primorskyibacter aestuariivivens]MDA7430811.1 Na(+)-translocating NADH-quinone reductase subunit A [Primorskyibacter aestuariivivens]
MKQFSLRKGLTLPITGAARPEVENGPDLQKIGVIADDYVGLKPRVLVAEGDSVVPGTPVFAHKDSPEAVIVAPAAGRITAINRGERRRLISIEIELDATSGDPMDFSAIGDAATREGLTERLCASGLWSALRTRPYSKIPEPGSVPAAIYITAIDSEPLAPDARPIIEAEAEAFAKGVEALSLLTDGTTYLCQDAGGALPGADLPGVEAAAFAGPHPAGLAGTHMHFLEPPLADKFVWTIGYQDVLMIGRLLLTGHYDASRIIALTGPECADPRLVRTVVGASLIELTVNDVPGDKPVRLISGSVLSGRAGHGASAYLGRFARQITVIEEDHKQIPMGWIRPMFAKYAVQPVLGSAFAKKLYPLTSNLNGGRRAMVPLGTFEELMPQDYLPTQLLRALLVMDTDQAQALGALELDEEDLGLVGFACPAKYEYGEALRDCLTKIEKEG